MITLLDPGAMIPTPRGLLPERHLRMGVYDIASPQPGMTLVSEAEVARILEFGRGWDGSAPMLIHCFAGISRSTASAFILACERSPVADERSIAMALRRAAPHAYPNRRIVALADALLGRGGRMIEAVEAMGDNGLAAMGAPFDFAARH